MNKGQERFENLSEVLDVERANSRTRIENGKKESASTINKDQMKVAHQPVLEVICENSE